MMKEYFKGRSLLLYLLSLLSFFLIGTFIAGLVGAGKHQGLAGGAIVLSYGMLTAAIGFVISLFVVAYARPATVISANRILFIIFVLQILFIIARVILL